MKKIYSSLICLLVRGEDESATTASQGFVSSERKEPVVMVGVDEALKDCRNQREASKSGDGEFIKMSNSGTQASISFSPAVPRETARKF